MTLSAVIAYCAECGRRLTKVALSLPVRDGVLNYGPKCASRFIIKPAKPKRVRIVTGNRRRKGDDRQEDLFGGSA